MQKEQVDASWRSRPLHPIKSAAELVGISPASIYRFADEGRLDLVRIAGRTLVKVEGLAALVDDAEPWAPSSRGAAARAARVNRAKASRREFAA